MMLEIVWAVTKLFVLSWLACLFGVLVVYTERYNSNLFISASLIVLALAALTWRYKYII